LPQKLEKGPAQGAVGATGGKTGSEAGAKPQAEPPPEALGPAFDRDNIGFEGKWWAIGISSAIAAVFLVYWFSRPKRQAEAHDPTTFAEALENRSEDILKKCGTPREVRRFLNYLRLVAAPNDEPSREGFRSCGRGLGISMRGWWSWRRGGRERRQMRMTWGVFI
jgi:hypothetical protein